MARRRKHKILRSASYYRANPLSTTELAIGGLVGAAVLVGGGILLYNYYHQTPTAAAGALPSGAQVAPSGAYGSAAPLFDAQGNPIPGAPLQQVGLQS